MKKLLYFSSKTCGPCRMFGPIIDGLSQQISITKVDIGNDMDQAKAYGVSSVPTTILLDESGAELGRFIGVKSKQQVLDFYNQ